MATRPCIILNIIMTLASTLLRPQVEYASAVWSPYTKENINKIEKSPNLKEGQPDGSQRLRDISAPNKLGH